MLSAIHKLLSLLLAPQVARHHSHREWEELVIFYLNLCPIIILCDLQNRIMKLFVVYYHHQQAIIQGAVDRPHHLCRYDIIAIHSTLFLLYYLYLSSCAISSFFASIFHSTTPPSTTKGSSTPTSATWWVIDLDYGLIEGRCHVSASLLISSEWNAFMERVTLNNKVVAGELSKLTHSQVVIL